MKINAAYIGEWINFLNDHANAKYPSRDALESQLQPMVMGIHDYMNENFSNQPLWMRMLAAFTYVTTKMTQIDRGEYLPYLDKKRAEM